MVEVPEVTVNGMTMTQYAFVRAGLADGLAVEELLGFLKIDAATWQAAEEAWDERILDAVGEVDADFFAHLDAHTAAARTHWTRRLPPLDEELSAWFAFLHAWANAPEPIEMLRRMGLAPLEIAYLHRLWSERMREDPKLREQALTRMGEVPGAPPVPMPEPPRLCKSRKDVRDDDNSTQEVSFKKGQILPFTEGEPAPMTPPLSVPLPQRARPRTAALGVNETAVICVAPPEAPLPFKPAEDSAPRQSAAPPSTAAVVTELLKRKDRR